MSLWKLAKSISKNNSEDVNEVFKRLTKNKKKLRRLEDRICAQNNKKQYESDNS